MKSTRHSRERVCKSLILRLIGLGLGANPSFDPPSACVAKTRRSDAHRAGLQLLNGRSARWGQHQPSYMEFLTSCYVLLSMG